MNRKLINSYMSLLKKAICSSIPGLGERYDIEIEIIGKTRSEYHSEAYSKTDLPAAPAIMVGEEIVVQGKDMSEVELEKIIRSRL